jgi:ferredoxin-type protein NapF
MPPLGQWIALLTLAGACLGYPLLLWLDPLAFFAGLFSLRHPLSGPAAWLSAMGVPVVLLLSLFLPGAWCARICPLGAMQDLLSRLTRHATVARQPVSGDGLLRRIILAAALGTVWAATVRTIRGSALLIKPLRPPGAIAEPNFLGVCIRCGNCTRICPSGIVAPDLGQHGLAGLLAPVVRFRHDYCREDCTRCMDVCPSGALQRLSVAEKRLAPLGLPRVDMNVCLLADDRECSICKNSCSYEAIALVFSPADYVLTPHVDPHKCPGCGACEAACPTTPTRAIVVYPLP